MIHSEIQYISATGYTPDEQQFQAWLEVVDEAGDPDQEIVIRIVGREESATLNEQYRNQLGPTNVLSFPVEVPEGVHVDLLGDLVICAPVVAEEAAQQHKAINDHWAHMVIHGLLHLLGYDHIDDLEAEQMEIKEIALLKQLNIKNPYSEIN